MAEAAVNLSSRKGLIAWMIVSQLLTLGSLFIWLLVAGYSVLAIQSGVRPDAWAVVIAVWAYPVIPATLVIAAWIAYARRRHRLAALLSGLSFVPPILLYVGVWLWSALWAVRYGA